MCLLFLAYSEDIPKCLQIEEYSGMKNLFENITTDINKMSSPCSSAGMENRSLTADRIRM